MITIFLKAENSFLIIKLKKIFSLDGIQPFIKRNFFQIFSILKPNIKACQAFTYFILFFTSKLFSSLTFAEILEGHFAF